MSTAKLAAGVCFYEKNVLTIQRCIESIKSHVDYIFAIDGRFDDFPDAEKLSSQSVRDYLKTIPNLVLVDLPATEIKKRQKYLDMCQQYGCEFLLIIDSDEFVLPESDWTLFRNKLVPIQNVNVYGIKYEYSYPVHHDATDYPRLWFKPWEMEYFHAHCLFRNKLTGVVQKSTSGGPLIEGIRMAGDDSLRSRDYQLKSFEYQTYLIENEAEIREKYR